MPHRDLARDPGGRGSLTGPRPHDVIVPPPDRGIDAARRYKCFAGRFDRRQPRRPDEPPRPADGAGGGLRDLHHRSCRLHRLLEPGRRTDQGVFARGDYRPSPMPSSSRRRSGGRASRKHPEPGAGPWPTTRRKAWRVRKDGSRFWASVVDDGPPRCDGTAEGVCEDHPRPHRCVWREEEARGLRKKRGAPTGRARRAHGRALARSAGADPAEHRRRGDGPDPRRQV